MGIRGRKYHSQHMTTSPSRADSGFAYSRPFFENLVDSALAHARKLGATDAGAEASEGCGLSVSVRKGELENVERNRDKSLGITVYVGHRRGNASTSDFSEAAIAQTVQAAYDIARFTAEDPVSGLPDEADIAKEQPELDLFHPWAVTQRAGGRAGARMRGGGARHRQAHHQQRRRRRLGAAEPFLQRPHARLSRRLRQLAPFDLGGADRRPRRRHAARRLVQLDALGRRTGQPGGGRPLCRRTRAVAAEVAQDQDHANARCCSSRRWPPGLLGGLVQATSGGALYRKSSFLLDSLGKPVLPAHIDVLEDPHVAARQGQLALRRRRRGHAAAQGGRRRPARGLLPQHLFGAQARHEDHRQRRRLAQPDAELRASPRPATTSTRCSPSSAPACS